MPRLAVVAVCAFLFLATLAAARAVAAAQLLQNGGFESGTQGWRTAGNVTTDCSGRTGGGAALRLSVTADAAAAARQDVAGVASGSGPYTLTGYSRLGSGAANAVAQVDVLDAAGDILAGNSANLMLGASFSQFSVVVAAAPAGAVALAVRLSAVGVQGSACLDDLTLEGPPPVTLTPTPVPTDTPSPTPVPQDTARPATATRTPRPPQPTSTPKPPTATRQPSPTKTAGAPSPRAGTAASGAGAMGWEGIVNGGFEEGIGPWQKFGGELSLVTAPVHSGSAAAALTSSTTSTKWLYQAVRVQEGAAYEFAGYLLADAGVEEAYLRVSWYESLDGSGSAIANADSTARLAGGSAGFAFLTTGAVVAPAGANSARLRAMLAPAGAGNAVLYADDLSFGPAETAAAAEPPSTDEEAPPDGTGGRVGPPRVAEAAAVSATEAPGRARRSSAVVDSGAGSEPLSESGPDTARSPSARTAVDLFQVAAAMALFAAGLVFTHQYLRRQRTRQ